MAEKIEKPWVVYGNRFAWGIGKITCENKHDGEINHLWINYQEKETYEHFWLPENVHRFDNSIKALAYFRMHQKTDNSQTKTINLFLRDFPSEIVNLENLLPKRFAQSQPKCTVSEEMHKKSQFKFRFPRRYFGLTNLDIDPLFSTNRKYP
jgi:hypothetical protein